MNRKLTTAIALALLLTACGGGSGTASNTTVTGVSTAAQVSVVTAK